MPDPRFDGCRVVEKLHSDAVADLYRAKQDPLGRLVLVKALTQGILPSSPFATALEREARLLSELDHPNIISLFDFQKRDDQMWLVLEHVDGWSVAELLEKLGRFTVPVAIAVALQVARALEHAHESGVVHRDVEPHNVLIAKHGAVKLVDFAVASDERLPTAPEILESSAKLSTPLYMSPEQILGEQADPRSDLFSLGVVLYEMLSGKRPFEAPDNQSATQSIRHDPPPLLGQLEGMSGVLERTVRRCLEKMPGDRFSSATELAEALEAALSRAGGGNPTNVIAHALHDAGLTLSVPSSDTKSEIAASPERASLAPAVRWLVLSLVLALAGGAAIQWFGADAGIIGGTRSRTRLELLPPRRAYLRVVAMPWAHVIVDGQRVATTPFARAIPLRAGKHYVRLEHPNAPTERREIELAPGETILLDVAMKVQAPPKPDAGKRTPGPPDAGDASADRVGPSP